VAAAKASILLPVIPVVKPIRRSSSLPMSAWPARRSLALRPTTLTVLSSRLMRLEGGHETILHL
jgi:hypothetical protein